MASTYFGNTLTDLQSGITAGERNVGDTERAKVAADAAKMSAYFNLLSSKAKTEAEAHAHEAENARQYFTLNMQDAQKKAELAQAASLAGQQWSNQFKLQEGALTSQKEIAAAQNEARLKEAGIQYAPGRLTPQLAVEEAKEKSATEEANTISDAMAKRANLALQGVRAKHGKAMEAANDAIRRSAFGNAMTFGGTDDRKYSALKQVADDAYNQDVLGILKQLDATGELITFDPVKNQFTPIKRLSPRAMLPSSLPSRPMVPTTLSQTNSTQLNIRRNPQTGQLELGR